MIAGIIGKPNTGKSTFFNAATLLNVPVANYPFTTINPNFGVGYLRTRCVCRDLGVTDNPSNSVCIDGERLIPVKLVDVAGLVPGASQGRGLGNKFLDDLRQADALLHVVDASGSTDEEGRPCPPGSRDPLLDVEFVEREFDLWLLEIVGRDWPRLARTAESGPTNFSGLLAEKLSGLSIGENQILEAAGKEELNMDRPTQWDDDDRQRFVASLRRISKPSLIVANKIDLAGATSNLERLKSTGRVVIPCAAEAELLLRRASERGLIGYVPGDGSFGLGEGARMTPEQRKALQLVEDRILRVWGNTGVQGAINAAYLDLLGGVVVFPVEDEHRYSDKKGRVLPDAYFMPRGSTAKDLARTVHTELGESFLYGVDARRGTRVGADYLLKNGDVIKIVATARHG